MLYAIILIAKSLFHKDTFAWSVYIFIDFSFLFDDNYRLIYRFFFFLNRSNTAHTSLTFCLTISKLNRRIDRSIINLNLNSKRSNSY